MYFLIVSFGFLLAMRGARHASLQKPVEELVRVWREAIDLLLTTGLTLTLLTAAKTFGEARIIASEYEILGLGIIIFLLSRYQKKVDAFFLAATAIAFMVSSKQKDLVHGLSLAWAACAGIALFQSGFLGLRYKLLFSKVPFSAKGWPILCLLGAFVSAILVGVARLVF